MGGVVSRSRPTFELHLLQFEREEALKEENDRRVRAAVKHVVGNIYGDAPVNIRLDQYPNASPKAGERRVLISLNHLVIQEQEKQCKSEGRPAAGFGAPQKSPKEVEVDNEGNIIIPNDDARFTLEGDQRVSPKSYRELKFDFDTAPRPAPPHHHSSTTTSITVIWEAPLGTIDLYELQFKRPDANIKGTVQWRTLTRTSERTATLGGISCATAFLFRVRAHNPVGWCVWQQTTERQHNFFLRHAGPTTAAIAPSSSPSQTCHVHPKPPILAQLTDHFCRYV